MILLPLLAAGFAAIWAEEVEETKTGTPHIIFVLADDLGWNDVSFHGSPQIPTPNIDALAASSIILHNYYTESLCTPSRASLLSGKYPIHIGLQHSEIKSGEPVGLPLDVMIMPEHFKNLGYETHMIGKWHLGYAKKEYTPLYRGFDSFFGFYNDHVDYFDYTNYEASEGPASLAFYGVDLQNGSTVIKDFRGRYATDIFTERALDIIANHNSTNPLFLYVAHLACHAGNDYMPLQAPLNLVAKNTHIRDTKRGIYADNGGEGSGRGKASNWPLRGQKGGSWEGAIRVPCFIWSPLLGLKESRTSKQLMHVSDWLPTLYTAAGGEARELGKIDGYSMWKALIKNSPSPRLEILHNIDPISGMACLRRGDYKLIKGTTPRGKDLWYGQSGFEDIEQPSSSDDIIFKNDSIVKQILEEAGMWLVKTSDSWRINVAVKCKQPPPTDNGSCDLNTSPCLFNVAADPCEYNNLAPQYPRIVKSMLEIIDKYNATATTPLSTKRDSMGDPRCHGFAHVPWMDQDTTSDCPYT
ncbi:Arylsulfatase B, partial [Stegodyphus mimosarum]